MFYRPCPKGVSKSWQTQVLEAFVVFHPQQRTMVSCAEATLLASIACLPSRYFVLDSSAKLKIDTTTGGRSVFTTHSGSLVRGAPQSLQARRSLSAVVVLLSLLSLAGEVTPWWGPASRKVSIGWSRPCSPRRGAGRQRNAGRRGVATNETFF